MGRVTSLHVERAGESGPAVVLVHGAGAPGWATWEAQRPLAERYRLLVVHRAGYPPNRPLEGIGFDQQADAIAELIEPRAHLVGHSYGGIISLIAAGRVGDRLASVTVIEPPAFGLARDEPVVDDLARRTDSAFSERGDARSFLIRFLPLVGSTYVPPDPLPPELEQSVEASHAEPPPTQAVIPFEAIRASGVPVLVVSGAHSAAYDAVCDVVVRELGAERTIIPGARHNAQRTGAPFNERLTAFIEATAAG